MIQPDYYLPGNRKDWAELRSHFDAEGYYWNGVIFSKQHNNSGHLHMASTFDLRICQCHVYCYEAPHSENNDLARPRLYRKKIANWVLLPKDELIELIHQSSRTGNIKISLADEMATAESFTFDDKLGVDFLDEPNFLFDGIVANEKIFPMGVQTMDDMIGGGVHENSLVLLMAPTNVGKTLMLCSMGASMLLAGKKVLYLTFEDPELKIYQRIAQNLMDLTQNQLKTMTRENFLQRFDQVKQRCIGGRLKIKHNPEFTTNALMINSMLKELKEREHFEPDVILLDYIGCMIPNGYSKDMNDNTRLTQVAMLQFLRP